MREIQNDIIIVKEDNLNIKKKTTKHIKEKKNETNKKNIFRNLNNDNDDDCSLISDYDSTCDNFVQNKSMTPNKKKSNYSNYKYNNFKRQFLINVK